MKSILGHLKQKLFYSPQIPTILAELRELRHECHRIGEVERRVRSIQEATGRVEARQTSAIKDGGLQEHEFRVYSQWGEDGIIQHLVREVPIARHIFVEFGVENYEEANTRFLLVNNNWAGLVIDASRIHVERICNSREYWRHNLKATQQFITRDNINDILGTNGIEGEIGLLSIDIDGMDYWIWKALDAVSPAIVVIEYNHRFGPTDAVTIPYTENFERGKAHHSILYYGASLKALELLGAEKGYALVGCGSNGLNAFFVRNDLVPASLKPLTAEEAFVGGQFCEAHNTEGQRVKMSPIEESQMVRSMPLLNIEKTNGFARR